MSLTRSQCYHYGFLFASIADWADSSSQYIKENPMIGEKGKNFINVLREGHNFIYGDKSSFKDRDTLTMYSFFKENALKREEIHYEKFERVAKTIDKAFDTIESSATAKKFINKVFGNLADKTHYMIFYRKHKDDRRFKRSA